MNTNKPFRDESLLTEQIAMGDMQAFTVLYERHHGYLYHFSLRFLKSPELAEEVVQEIFLKLWENREKLDPNRSLKGYLIKSCKNHILNLIDRSLREQAWRKETQETSTTLHSDTEASILLADYENLAEKAIAGLPPRRQEIFRLYRKEHRSIDEIAQLLNISKGTVKDHLLKATRQLKVFMKHHSGIPIEAWLLMLLFR